MKRSTASLLACLTVLLLTSVPDAAPQAGRALDNNPDVIAVLQYRLTMDKVNKLLAATDGLNKVIAADPSLRKRMGSGSDNDETIDQKVKRFDSEFPQGAAVVHASGLSTRDYIMVTLAFLNDVAIVGMKKEGMIKEYPANSVTPENAAFVEQNYDKLKQISEKLSPLDDNQ